MPSLTDINKRPFVHYSTILAHEYDPNKHGRLFKANTPISQPSRNYLKIGKDQAIAGPEEFFMIYEGAFTPISSPPKKKKSDTEEPKIMIVNLVDPENFYEDEIRAIKMLNLKKRKKEVNNDDLILENKVLKDEVDNINQKFFHLEDTVRILKEKLKKMTETEVGEKFSSKKKERKD